MFKIIIISLFASSVLGAAIEERQDITSIIQMPMDMINVAISQMGNNAVTGMFQQVATNIINIFGKIPVISTIGSIGAEQPPKPAHERDDLFVREYLFLLNKISESVLSALTNSKRIWDEYKSLVHFSIGKSTLTV